MKRQLVLHDSTIAATGALTAFQCRPYHRGVLTINVTAIPQNTPSIYMELECSPDNSVWFFNHGLADKERVGDLTRTSAPVSEHKITTVSKHLFNVEDILEYVRINVVAFGGSGSPATFTLKAILTLFG